MTVKVSHAVVLNGEAAVGNSEVDLAPLGGKGAALARLINHRHPVPVTGVVTTSAYRAVRDANPAIGELIRRIDDGAAPEEREVDRVFEEAHIAEDVARSIADMMHEVGAGGPVAVRSSATVEDLSGSSFAGQYRSLLNVDSSDDAAAIDAVRAVWASLWYPAPSAYRQAFGVSSDDVAMAVVVMAMIPATTAGVVFTADPAGSNGARVEAVDGLGESLVSGERTPSAWVVPHETAGEGNKVALPSAARRALELSLAVESDFGVPQDIEWAAIDDDVYVVQARPITVMETDDGFDTAIDEHELTTAGIAELVPGIVSPLLWQLNSFMLEQAFRSVLDSLGIIHGGRAEERPFIRRVRGRVALDFDQLRDAAATVPGAVAQLETQYFGRADERPVAEPAMTIGRRWLRSVRRFARDVRTARTRRWVIDHADVLIAAIGELRDRRPDLTAMTDRELLQYHRRLLDLAARGLLGELGVAAAGGAAYEQLELLLEKYVGVGEGAAAAQLATARSGAATERSVHASAAIFGGPTWADLGSQPPVITTEADAFREDLHHLEERISTQPGWRRRRILTGQFIDVRLHMVRRTAVEAVEQLRRREASKAAFLELGGEARRVHTEFGARFMARGILTAAADIELLSTNELAAALDGTLEMSVDRLRRRRNWLNRYDVEGQLPLRFHGVPDRESKPLPEGDVLTGWAASAGRHSGPVRIVTRADGHFEAGEVLVAEATDASWSPLFVRAGAVVVERGGPLSHAAILARELGLPAVLNVEGATSVLQGCTVAVDGDQGVVVIEDRGTS